MSTWELLAELARGDRGLRARSPCSELVSSDFERKSTVDPPARRRRAGPRRGRHLRRGRSRDPAGGRPDAAAGRALHAGAPSPSAWPSSRCSRSRPSARSRSAIAPGRMSRPRSTSRCARRARRCTRRSRASPSRCASWSRCASASHRRSSRCAGAWTRYPRLRFKLDPTSSWDEALIAAAGRHGRGRLGGLQGPTTWARSSTSRPTRCSTGASPRRSPTRGSRIPALTSETDAVLGRSSRALLLGCADPLDR